MLDGLSGATSVVTKPKDIFVSTNIPIDMNVSDGLQTKIYNDNASSSAGPMITVESNQKSK